MRIFKLTYSLATSGKRVVVSEYTIVKETPDKLYVVKALGITKSSGINLRKTQINFVGINNYISESPSSIYLTGWADKEHLNEMETKMFDLAAKKFQDIKYIFMNLEKQFFNENKITRRDINDNIVKENI